MRSRLVALSFASTWLASPMIAGCYLSHMRGEPVDASAGDASVLDAPDAPPTLVPRLLSPLSTSRVTTRRPTLRFVVPAGASSVRVELCLDRACAMPIASLAADTGTARPTDALPPGWVYWRAVTPTGTSATWQLAVPAREAGADTAWGVALDLDGDGYEEAVRDVENGAEVSSGIFHGTPAGTAPDPREVVPPTACNTRSTASPAGDLDGDGLGDLLLADHADGCRPGIVRVFLGAQLPSSVTPERTLTDFVPDRPGFGRTALGLGDVDGDGYGDVAIGVRERYGNTGSLTAEVFRGTPAGIALDRGQSIVVDHLSLRSEVPPLAAADFNGDRLADLVVGPSVFLGPALAAPSFTLERDVKAVAVGDVNGDGYADWAAASDVVDPSVETARVSVFHGGPSGIGGTPATFLVGADQYFGNEVTIEDLDGDGFDDLTVWAPLGASVVYRGSPGGLVVP